MASRLDSSMPAQFKFPALFFASHRASSRWFASPSLTHWRSSLRYCSSLVWPPCLQHCEVRTSGSSTRAVTNTMASCLDLAEQPTTRTGSSLNTSRLQQGRLERPLNCEKPFIFDREPALASDCGAARSASVAQCAAHASSPDRSHAFVPIQKLDCFCHGPMWVELW